MRPATVIGALLVVTTVMTPASQLPGDRPAGNPRATRSVVMARNGVDRDEPAAGVGRGAARAAAGRQRDRRRGHGRRRPGRCRADDERPRRRSLRHRLRPEGEAGARPQRQRTRAGRGDAGRVQASQSRPTFPYRGVLSVSVPGVVDGWNELLTKHGTITLARALEPAIGYARDGFAVSEIIAGQWQAEEALLAQDPAAAATFLPGGKAPAAGDVFRNPRLASTLEQIAKGGRDAFYRGAIAQSDRRRHDGARRPADRGRPGGAYDPTGSSRSRRAIAATTSSSCRPTRRASSRSRC